MTATCTICGGHHGAFECAVQSGVSELIRRFGGWTAPLCTSEGIAYLERLGADREVALTAAGRWAADNNG